MNYLAINTAVGAEILLSYKKKDHYFAFPEKIMAAGFLLPAVQDLLKNAGIALQDLETFVCVTGPGSFTGIRIGVATIRAFAYALDKPALGVTYFDLLAYNSIARFGGAPFTAVVDGGAGAAYLKNFDGDNTPPFAVKREDILKNSHKNIIADPFFSYQLFEMDAKLAKTLAKASAGITAETASGIITETEAGGHSLNFIKLERGKDPLKTATESAIAQNKFMGYADLVPLYLRRSQPEREAGEV